MSSTERVIDRMNEPNASRSSIAPDLGGLAEHVDQLGGLGRKLRHQPRPVSGRASSRSSHERHSRLPSSGGVSLAVAGGRPPQRLQSLGGARGVLAEVEPDGGEAENLDRAAHRLDQIDSDRRPARLAQRVLDHAQIVDQLVGISVRPRRPGDVLP